MALYRHVGSKDELLMVLVDRLAARLTYPPRPPDPKGVILVLWSTIYDSLAEHSWIPPSVRSGCEVAVPRRGSS